MTPKLPAARQTRPQSRNFSAYCALSTGMIPDIVVCGNLEIQRIKCLSDNFAWLITSSSKSAIVDPSESGETLPLQILGNECYIGCVVH
jgi:hypothetical protein